jgi:hypothetical protein
MGDTKAEYRFKQFIQEVKDSKSDLEIARAGWHLLEMYRAFRYNIHSDKVYDLLTKLLEKTPQIAVSEQLVQRMRYILALEEAEAYRDDPGSIGDIADMFMGGIKGWNTISDGEVVSEFIELHRNDDEPEKKLETVADLEAEVLDCERGYEIDPPTPKVADNGFKGGTNAQIQR